MPFEKKAHGKNEENRLVPYKKIIEVFTKLIESNQIFFFQKKTTEIQSSNASLDRSSQDLVS